MDDLCLYGLLFEIQRCLVSQRARLLIRARATFVAPEIYSESGVPSFKWWKGLLAETHNTARMRLRGKQRPNAGSKVLCDDAHDVVLGRSMIDGGGMQEGEQRRIAKETRVHILFCA
jgi:hypothetical protein